MAKILWPNGQTTPPKFSWEGHFGKRNANLSYASRNHFGLDMYDIGTVRSIADGTVVHVGVKLGWFGGGYMVWVQHDGFFSRYLHLAYGSTVVSKGQRVSAGQALATEGNTPFRVPPMAKHLHLEITPGQWHSGNYGQVDPKAWLYEHVNGAAPAGIDQDASAPATPAPSGISINSSVKGDIMAETYVAAAGDQGTYPKGKVFYTRPGLKKAFESQDDYHAWQKTINGLIDAGCSNMLRVPPLPEVKTLSDWRVKAILDANGV